jgi:hypothetical protein
LIGSIKLLSPPSNVPLTITDRTDTIAPTRGAVQTTNIGK